MADRILTLREINRATLARQMLLERASLEPTIAVERLAGMQAQLASAPYIGLWTRLADFSRAALADAIEERKIVKATLMRATLHLMSAADYLRFRTTLNPVLEDAAKSIAKNRTPIDKERVLKLGREFIAEQPRTFAEISAMLAAEMPEADIGAMRYTLRTHIPMVQVPVNTGWSYSATPAFTLAEKWLEQPISNENRLHELIRCYLAAFGPATITDMQTWSFLKLADLKPVFDALRSELVVYRDDKKKELFDIRQTTMPTGDHPAPPRFLPEFDNLLLSHKIRTRILADEYRKKVYLPGLRVAATILIDGFVGAVWKIEKTRGVAALNIEPLVTIPAALRSEIAAEGERLLHFVEADAKDYEVRWTN